MTSNIEHDYDIVQRHSFDLLIEDVKDLLRSGWRLAGGITCVCLPRMEYTTKEQTYFGASHSEQQILYMQALERITK